MQAYREFSPTCFDVRGLGCDDRQDWLVAPCSTNRDADRLTRSNWEVMCAGLERVDPEGDFHEIHRFGHWGCGWFEIVLVRPGPGSAPARECEAIEAALADYPILDDSHYSELECEEMHETWDRMRLKERVALCVKHGVSIFAARRDAIPESLSLHEDLLGEY